MFPTPFHLCQKQRKNTGLPKSGCPRASAGDAGPRFFRVGKRKAGPDAHAKNAGSFL